MPEIKNARITRTTLGVEDHGILTAFLHLEGDGWGIGFGGYALDEPRKDAEGRHAGRFGTAYGMEWIRQVMETLCVESWEKLPGTHVRVETQGWGGVALRIGHITKERWFDPNDRILASGGKP